MEDVKLAPARWIDWLNRRGLCKYGRDLAPVELRGCLSLNAGDQPPAEVSDQKVSDSPGRFKRPSFGCEPTMRKATVYGE